MKHRKTRATPAGVPRGKSRWTRERRRIFRAWGRFVSWVGPINVLLADREYGRGFVGEMMGLVPADVLNAPGERVTAIEVAAAAHSWFKM